MRVRFVFFKRYLWLGALLLALAYAGADSGARLRSIASIQDGFSATTKLTLDPNSPTGYALGERTLILPYIGTDGYHWIMQTQLMLAGQGGRIRSVDYDNWPDQREVHWSSIFRWWLAGVAWFDHLATGAPWPIAVEHAAPYANTLLLVILLAALVPVMARRFGSGAAAMLALGMVAVRPYYSTFMVGNPDHHGLAATGCLLTVLFLLAGGAGWIRREGTERKSISAGDTALAAWLPDLRQARRWFAASGIAGGAGLWISAATETPVLLGVGLGALAATGWLGRKVPENEPWQTDPTLWRVWGWAGGAASLFFYLLEYFPSHFGWRLEVNHPLYALAWVGGGELLCRLCGIWQGQRATTGWDWLALGLSVGAVAALPTAVYFASARVFWVTDPFLWMFHEDYIAEFKGLIEYVGGMPWSMRMSEVSMLPVMALIIPWLLWRRHFARLVRAMVKAALPTGALLKLLALAADDRREMAKPAKALLALAWLAGLFTLALAVRQMRWTGMTDAVWLAILPAMCMVLAWPSVPAPRWWGRAGWGVFLALVAVPSPVIAIKEWCTNGWHDRVEWEQIVGLVTRDVAQKLRSRLGDKTGVVVSGPTTTTWMIYYGGFRGLGTLYWENLAGLKATAAIYSAPTADQAFELIKKHGVTHLAIFSWDAFAREYALLAQGRHKGVEPPEDAFILRLLRTDELPNWLREIRYPLPKEKSLENNWVKLYEVVPDQSPEEALVRAAQTDLANGQMQNAVNRLQKALQTKADYLPALIVVARLQQRLGPAEAFKENWQRIRNLAEGDVVLETTDRLDLIQLALLGNDPELARRELQIFLTTTDLARFGQINPEGLFNVIQAAQDLNVRGDQLGIVTQAVARLPVALQAQLQRHQGTVALQAGQPAEAIAHYRQALAIHPESLEAIHDLARVLATSPADGVRNGREAVALAQKALTLVKEPGPQLLDTLACAYAENGDFPQAEAIGQQALQSAEAAKQTALASAIRTRISFFHNHLAYRGP